MGQDLRLPGGLLALGLVSQLLSYKVSRRIAVHVEAYSDAATGDEMVDVHHLTLFGRGVKTYRRQGEEQWVHPSSCVPHLGTCGRSCRFADALRAQIAWVRQRTG